MDVTEKLQETLTMKSLEPNLEDRDKGVIQAFDVEFTKFPEIVTT